MLGEVAEVQDRQGDRCAAFESERAAPAWERLLERVVRPAAGTFAAWKNIRVDPRQRPFDGT